MANKAGTPLTRVHLCSLSARRNDFGSKPGQDHHRAAGLQQRLDRPEHRVLVVKGNGDQRPLPGFDRPVLLRAPQPPELAGVRQDHALGLARGARGVGEEREVAGLDPWRIERRGNVGEGGLVVAPCVAGADRIGVWAVAPPTHAPARDRCRRPRRPPPRVVPPDRRTPSCSPSRRPTCARASKPSFKLRGTGTAPARMAPNMISTNSKRLPTPSATRSPRRTHAPANSPATRSIRWPISS